ncbi:MAG: hypothetical protein WD577_09635 [Bacteroidales bacterium]
MKKSYIVLLVIAGLAVGCSKTDVPDPEIYTFSVDRTTFPSRDTVKFAIDAAGDFITFYDGKSVIDLSDEEMPYEHIVGKIRFRVTGDADTVYAKLAVTNVYDTDNIKSVNDSIELILLKQ